MKAKTIFLGGLILIVVCLAIFNISHPVKTTVSSPDLTVYDSRNLSQQQAMQVISDLNDGKKVKLTHLLEEPFGDEP